MTEKKKTWVEPELIVLVRNKPEEAILCGCKSAGKGSAYNNENRECLHYTGCPECAMGNCS